MQDLFGFADELGPAKIIHIYQPNLGLKAIVVIDNIACGPSIGGVRMAPDVSAAEAFRLARAMTLKNAAAGLPHGGGKSVVFGQPRIDPTEKERLIRGFARAIADLTDYIPGPDMGTDERCMAWVKDEIGRSVGLPREIGGIPLDEIGATGFGVAVSIDVAKDFCDIELAGARVAVQGFGSVGSHAARLLSERGARLVAAADSRGTVIDPNGLDVTRLIAAKHAGQSVIESGQGEPAAVEAIIDVPCDIWIPAARPDVIDGANQARIQASLVVEGANIAVTAAAGKMLHERGVLVVPDFVANAGGVISAAVEYRGGTETDAFQVIEEKIRANTEQVLRAAAEAAQTPRAAAETLARQRVLAAMDYRRKW